MAGRAHIRQQLPTLGERELPAKCADRRSDRKPIRQTYASCVYPILGLRLLRGARRGYIVEHQREANRTVIAACHLAQYEGTSEPTDQAGPSEDVVQPPSGRLLLASGRPPGILVPKVGMQVPERIDEA